MLMIEADVYSGRPNPRWIVNDPAVVDEILVAVSRRRGMVGRFDQTSGTLGFRGLLVRLLRESDSLRYDLPRRFRLGGGRSDDEQAGVEVAARIVDTLPVDGRNLSGTSFTAGDKSFLARQLEGAPPRPRRWPTQEEQEEQGSTSDFTPSVCNYDALPYDAAWWNNDQNTLLNNNCYNYACDQATDTFAQPGRWGSGDPNWSFGLDCADASQAVLLDGNHSWGDCWSPVGNGGFYLFALVIWPDQDFHFFRYSAEGWWGNKPGHTAVINLDYNGQLITDPQTSYNGPYSDFCGYFQTSNQVQII